EDQGVNRGDEQTCVSQETEAGVLGAVDRSNVSIDSRSGGKGMARADVLDQHELVGGAVGGRETDHRDRGGAENATGVRVGQGANGRALGRAGGSEGATKPANSLLASLRMERVARRGEPAPPPPPHVANDDRGFNVDPPTTVVGAGDPSLL
ncbi:unnamed protein product, partial [Discosporangium mesarthrocarpum]